VVRLDILDKMKVEIDNRLVVVIIILLIIVIVLAVRNGGIDLSPIEGVMMSPGGGTHSATEVDWTDFVFPDDVKTQLKGDDGVAGVAGAQGPAGSVSVISDRLEGCATATALHTRP